MQLSAVYPMQFGEVVATAYLWSQKDGGMDLDAQQQFLERFLKRLPMPKQALVAIKGQIQEAGGFHDKDPGWPEMDLATPLDPELVHAALKKRKASQSTQKVVQMTTPKILTEPQLQRRQEGALSVRVGFGCAW